MNPNLTNPNLAGSVPISTYLADDRNTATQQAQTQAQPATQTAAPTKQVPWYEKILPTAGGILGGIAGGAADVASLGALAPIINPITGAAVGGALGKVAENATDRQGIGSGVLGSAVSNGIGALGGEVVGKGLQAVAGKVLSPLASKFSDAALQGQFKGTLDAGTAKVLSDMGITDARQVGQIAPLVTQSGGALSTGVKTALQESADNGAGVDVTGIDKIANNVMAEKGFQNPNSLTTVSHNVNQAINNMVPGSVGKVAGKAGNAVYTYEPGSLANALPENVFKQSQKMDSLASEAYNKAYDKTGAVINSDELAKGQAYSKVADELQNRAFNVNGQPLALSDTAKQSIIDQLAPIKDINLDVYNHYVGAVQKANTVQELRPLQADMVNASKAYQSTQRILSKGGGLAGSDIARGAVGLATRPVKAVAGMAFNSPAADRAAASGLSTLSKVTGKAAAGKMIPLLSRTAAISAANLPEDVPTPTGTQAITPGSTTATIGNQGTTMQNGQAMTPASLLQTLLQQEEANPLALAGSLAGPINSLEGTVNKQQLLAPALNQAISGYQNAGGSQGLMGGLLSRATGLISGTPANTYNADQGTAAAALAQLLGITPQQALTMLPQLTQTAQTAAPQMNSLQSILGGLPQGSAQPIS